MTPQEVSRLLAACAAYDLRKVGETDVIAWLQVVGDLPYADAERAVIGHYTDSTERIMPAHIRDRVREMRGERLRNTPMPDPPDGLGDNPDAYREWLVTERKKIMDGPPELRALEAS